MGDFVASKRLALAPSDVRFGSKADMYSAKRHVRFVPKADIAHRYSITSSARRTVKPSEPSQLGLIERI